MLVSVKKKIDSSVASYIEVDTSLKSLTLTQPEREEPEEKINKKEPLPEPQPEPPQPEPQPKPQPPTPSIFNLQDALQGVKKREVKGDEGIERRIDPSTESKIESARGEILNYLRGSRPRFVPLFEQMTLSQNSLSIETPTEDLRIEVLRNETEVISKVAQIAGVEGYIELVVRVNERLQPKRRLVKVEDRIAHFTKLNPAVVEMTEVLDLQVD